MDRARPTPHGALCRLYVETRRYLERRQRGGRSARIQRRNGSRRYSRPNPRQGQGVHRCRGQLFRSLVHVSHLCISHEADAAFCKRGFTRVSLSGHSVLRLRVGATVKKTGATETISGGSSPGINNFSENHYGGNKWQRICEVIWMIYWRSAREMSSSSIARLTRVMRPLPSSRNSNGKINSPWFSSKTLKVRRSR